MKVQLAGFNALSLAEVQVWGQGGGAGGAGGATDVEWIVSDQLGTPRMVVDQSGARAGVKRHDYLPFGEELFAGSGGRTTSQGYSVSDGVRQKFTDKERDVETGLDYSINRYYSSLQGRFTSPDPLNSSGIPGLPQSWNRYSYTINNPLLYTDPKGLIWGYKDIEENGRHLRRFQWFDGDTVGEGFTPYTQSNYFSNQAGTEAVWLGYNGHYRYISQQEYAAGVLDEYLRGSDSPLSAEEKGKLEREFALRMYNEHRAEIEIPATLAGSLAGGIYGSIEESLLGSTESAIDAEALTLTDTVEKHLSDVSKIGTKARPYGDSRLVMREIMEGGKPVPDPGGVPGALRWDVPGAVNGSKGTWELVVDPKTSTVLHFVFKSTK